MYEWEKKRFAVGGCERFHYLFRLCLETRHTLLW